MRERQKKKEIESGCDCVWVEKCIENAKTLSIYLDIAANVIVRTLDYCSWTVVLNMIRQLKRKVGPGFTHSVICLNIKRQNNQSENFIK